MTLLFDAFRKCSTAGILLLAVTAHLGAQSDPRSTATATKNADGVQLLHQALARLGDPNALLAAQSCDISETVTPSGGSAISVEWTIDADDYLLIAHTAAGISQLASRAPVAIQGKLYTPGSRMRLTHFEPASATQWLARAIMRPTISISSVTRRSIDGKTFLAVQLADITNPIVMLESEQVWYFDPNSYMPVRIDYKLPSITRSGLAAPTHVLILGFHDFSGILFPSALQTYIGEIPETAITVSSAACSTQLPPASRFAVDGGTLQ